MNILYILNDIVMGGDSVSLIELIRKSNDYINAHVIVNGDGPAFRVFSAAGIDIRIVEFQTGFGRAISDTEANQDHNFIDNFDAAQKICKIIESEKIDIIHINSSTSNIGMFAALMTNTRCIWHLREVLDDFDHTLWDKNLKRELFDKSDLVITISDYCKKRYQELYNTDSERIYDGFDISKYEFVEKKDENAKFKILFAGGVSESKGVWEAVISFAILVNKYCMPAELYIVGGQDKNLLYWIEQALVHYKIKERVHIIDYTDNLLAYRKECLISLTCSLSEALGRITVEGMLAGNIVIGASNSATAELIGNNERGFLYKRGDFEELALKMKNVIEMPEIEIKRILHTSREFAESQFDSSSYANEIAKKYEYVLSNSIDEEGRIKLLSQLKKRYESIKYVDEVINKTVNTPSDLRVKYQEVIEQKEEFFSWLSEKGYKKIAIYGMGQWGTTFYKLFKESNTEIAYFIDKNPDYKKYCLEYRENADNELCVDAIIVCAVKEKELVIAKLQKETDYKVIYIGDLLKEFLCY